MTNLLIAQCPLGRDRMLAYPQDEIRVDGMWGMGRLIYVTEDGWCGIRLDGETRIDEYPADQLSLDVSDALVALAA
jgi:hypothetical protein